MSLETTRAPQRKRGACLGRGDSPSRNWNALLLRVSALWMGIAVSQTDDAQEALQNMCAAEDRYALSSLCFDA